MDDPDFRVLLSRWQAGDRAAVDELCRRYWPYVHMVVRRQLDARLRQLFDSLDFTQDVWMSFLEVKPDQHNFDSPQALLGFLTRVAHHKLAEAFRHHVGTMKHDLNRQVSIEGQGSGDETGVQSPSASPSEWAVATEQWERLLRCTPPGHRAIVERLREGYTYDEIARMSQLSTRTIKRIVGRLKEVAHL